MSNPGASDVSDDLKCEKNEEIGRIYSEMTDDAILTHIKAILNEVATRPTLNKSMIPPSLATQITEEMAGVTMIDPKTESLDEEYLVLHEKSSGIEYNHLNGSFSCNSRFSDNNDIRRTNELNNYGRHLHIAPPPDPAKEPKSSETSTTPRPPPRSTPLTTKPSAKYWSKKGGDPPVDCECSICHKKFSALRALLDHRLEDHSEEAMLTCGFCEKTFSTRTHMYLHLSQEYKLHHCTACNISFSSNWHKEKHNCLDAVIPTKKSIIDKFSIDIPAGEVKEEIDDDETYGNTVGAALKKGFSCDLCGKQYYHEHWSIKHREKCARKVQKQTLDAKVQEFKCSICLRQYNTQYWFDCHKKKCSTTPTSTVILPYDTKVRCELCGKMFQHARSLEFHLRHCRAKQKRNEAAHATRHATQHATQHATHHFDMPILEDNSMASTSSIIKKRRIQEDSDDVVPPIVGMFGEEAELPKGAELPGGAESCEEAEPQEDSDDEEYKGTNPFTVPMKCSICSHICTGVSHLLTHRKNHHGTESMLQCGRCQARFNSISSIRRHMNQEYSLYVCQKCGRNCKDSSDRRDHLCPPGRHLAIRKTVSRRRLQSVMSTVTTASSSARKCVKCPTCFESFATSTVMFNHRMTCDPRKLSISDEKRAELNTVEEESSTRESSEEPEEDEETQILQCPDCPSQFNFLCDIVRHRHESHGKERFECLFCPRHFAILRTLQDHHNLETKRWTCHRCDRPFSRRYQSEYHEAYCGVQRQDGPRKFPIYN